MHNWHDDPDGSEGNDIFVSMKGIKTTQGMGWDKAFSTQIYKWIMYTSFHHEGKTPDYGLIQWVLPAGVQTLQISGRSKGMSIDRVHLSLVGMGSGSTSPNSPESERVGYAYNADVTPAPVFLTTQGEHGFTYLKNYDLWGNDLASTYGVKSIDACAAICKNLDGCNAFTFHSWGGCFQKTSSATKKFVQGAWSGFVENEDITDEAPPTEAPVITVQIPTVLGCIATQFGCCKGENGVDKEDELGSNCAPNPVTTGVSFADLNPNGNGCCRFEGGSPGHGTYTHLAAVTSVDECQNLCASDSACSGYEVSSWEGCELHTMIPSFATTTIGCTCRKKVSSDEAQATDAPVIDVPATAAPVTAAPVTDKPVTAAPVTDAPVTDTPATKTVISFEGVKPNGVGCCRFGGKNSLPSTFTLLGGVKEIEGCKTVCSEDSACKGFEFHAANGCEIHTLFPDTATANAACSCMQKVETVVVIVSEAPPTEAPTPAPTPAPVTDAPIAADTGGDGDDNGGDVANDPGVDGDGGVAATDPPAASTGSPPIEDVIPEATACIIVPGVNYQGFDLPDGLGLAAASHTECAAMCVKHSLCSHFTYVWGGCYLKTSGDGSEVQLAGTSGICIDEQDEGAIPESSCTLIVGTDFYGADLANGNPAAESAQKCADLCLEHALCSHFTYVWGGCYLKSSSGEASEQISAISGECTRLPADGSGSGGDDDDYVEIDMEHACTADESIDYYGGDIPGLGSQIATNADMCAAMCNNHERCLFYTFGYGFCHFKSSDAGRKYMPGSTSGSCHGITHAEAEESGNYEFICEVTEPGFDFYGGDLESKPYVGGVKTADDCGTECESTAGCTHFTHVNDFCYLKTSGNGRYPSEASASGTCIWMHSGDDSCISSNNGKCDHSPVCETGTDFSDCDYEEHLPGSGSSGSPGFSQASICIANACPSEFATCIFHDTDCSTLFVAVAEEEQVTMDWLSEGDNAAANALIACVFTSECLPDGIIATDGPVTTDAPADEPATDVKPDKDHVTATKCVLIKGMDFYGNDIPGGYKPDAASADECATMCLEDEVCSHFTFIWGTCYLKSNNDDARSQPSGISGDCTGTASEAPVTEAPDVSTSCEFINGVDYYGNDIPGGYKPDAASADECAAQCLAHEVCSHFTFIWGACYLKSSGEDARTQESGISGHCARVTAIEADVTEALPTPTPTEAPTEAPAETEAPATDDPVIDVPATVAPVTAAPVTDQPVTAAPVTEAPTPASTEAPTEAPAETEAPATDALVIDVPATAAPVTAAPVTDQPVTAAPVTEAPTPASPMDWYRPVNPTGIGCCRGMSGSSAGAFELSKNTENIDECAVLCSATKQCVGFEMSPAGCELHGMTIKYATQNSYCSCYTKADEPLLTVVAATDAPEVTLAPEATDPAPSVGTGTYKYSQLPKGCCRSTLNPENEGTSVTFYINVIAQNSCSDLCNKDQTCTGFEISNWNGCELHSLLPDYTSGTVGCKCFIKGDEKNVLEVFEQPEVSTNEPQVLTSDEPFSKVGGGCCMSTEGGQPAWLTWLPGYTYSLCEYACAIDGQCKGFEHKKQASGNFVCKLSESAIGSSNKNGNCSCYVKN
jgi:hypothetical protein